MTQLRVLQMNIFSLPLSCNFKLMYDFHILSWCLLQVREFWEAAFRCTFSDVPLLDEDRVLCTGKEDLTKTSLLMSDLRYEFNVYNAVYDLAHALHDLLQCVPGRGPFTGHSCGSLQTIQAWQV